MISYTLGVSLPFLFLCLSYIVYQRCFHPLAKYPGPWVASLTNLWKAYQVSTLRMPYILSELHDRHGPILRIGPNTLSFSHPDAIAPIYQAGRAMKKSRFYDAFTAITPNIFGTQDEDFHAMRRRQLIPAFSMASVMRMEEHLDRNIAILRRKLDERADARDVFDLKDYLSRYIIDVLGELAFSKSFETQTSETAELPPVKDHVLLATMLGQVPVLLAPVKRIIALLPIPRLQKMFESRDRLRKLAVDSVAKRLEKKSSDGRIDLLMKLIDAKDSETGRKLTKPEIDTEAFGLIIAGTHSTAGTLSLLFWHLLHNPGYLERCREELLCEMGMLRPELAAYPVGDLEINLEFLMACIRENLRMDPVFNMPLPRIVLAPAGAEICGELIPYGTEVAMVNHCVHHNAAAWGVDHDTYDPTRWLDERAEAKLKWLIPFSVGHRMCIGKNIAMSNILKITTTLVACYDFDLLDTSALRPDVISVGVAELRGQILCRVRKRT
ncbi:hypothetical protein PVAG01_08429 [Phlyctema vagabunda]|uniref:Cytochrome P450 n=1 Tax=Phlyctema vagabunda TaxID=108571 RepID=A0ABR4P9G2_9HELO